MYRSGHLDRGIIYVALTKNNSNIEEVVKKPNSMSEGITDDPFSKLANLFLKNAIETQFSGFGLILKTIFCTVGFFPRQCSCVSFLRLPLPPSPSP